MAFIVEMCWGKPHEFVVQDVGDDRELYVKEVTPWNNFGRSAAEGLIPTQTRVYKHAGVSISRTDLRCEVAWPQRSPRTVMWDQWRFSHERQLPRCDRRIVSRENPSAGNGQPNDLV